MLSSVRSFISRHRYKFIFGGIAIGGVVLISDYAKRVWKDAQENETKEILERNRKHQHYEGTEEICNKTAMTTAPTLNAAVYAQLPTKDIVNCLMSGPSNMVELWEKLMVLSFTKAVVMVYASSLVIILLRIQLNLIGGYIFRDSADGTKRLDTASQDKYFTLYNNLFEKGLTELITIIKTKVEDVLKTKSLKHNMTIKDIEKVFWAIQTSIKSDLLDPCQIIVKYCLPSCPMLVEYHCDGNKRNRNLTIFDRIVGETRDIIESTDIRELVQSTLDSGFTVLMDELTYYFVIRCNSLNANKKNGSQTAVASTSSGRESASFDSIDLSKLTLPMARIIPIVNGIVPDTYKNHDFAGTLMMRLISMDSLKAMGANVYETFSSN